MTALHRNLAGHEQDVLCSRMDDLRPFLHRRSCMAALTEARRAVMSRPSVSLAVWTKCTSSGLIRTWHVLPCFSKQGSSAVDSFEVNSLVIENFKQGNGMRAGHLCLADWRLAPR